MRTRLRLAGAGGWGGGGRADVSRGTFLRHPFFPILLLPCFPSSLPAMALWRRKNFAFLPANHLSPPPPSPSLKSFFRQAASRVPCVCLGSSGRRHVLSLCAFRPTQLLVLCVVCCCLADHSLAQEQLLHGGKFSLCFLHF